MECGVECVMPSNTWGPDNARVVCRQLHFSEQGKNVPADESTLLDENPPLEGFLANFSVKKLSECT